MANEKDERQKFMLKLPQDMHRELIAYAGATGEALSDIMLRWVKQAWAQQPERETIVAMLNKINPSHAKTATTAVTPSEAPPPK